MEVGVYPVRIGQQRDVLKFKSSTVIPSQQITPRRVLIKIISVGLILQSWAELSKQLWRKTIKTWTKNTLIRCGLCVIAQNQSEQRVVQLEYIHK